jgi:hypothetical protein
VWTSCGPLSAATFNHSISEKWLCGCIWGQVVPIIPSLQSWAMQRSTLGSEGFLLMGPI